MSFMSAKAELSGVCRVLMSIAKPTYPHGFHTAASADIVLVEIDMSFSLCYIRSQSLRSSSPALFKLQRTK